jgi:hypothetical protein
MSHSQNPLSSSEPPPKKSVSVVAKLNLFLVAVFGTVLLTCCLGGWFLKRFDATVEVTDAASIKDVLDTVPLIELPPSFKPTKAVVRDSILTGTAKAVQWETKGGSRIILGSIDMPYDSDADPGATMKMLPVKNPIGISYEVLKSVLPSTSVEINGTLVQLRVVNINPETQEGSIVGVFPTTDNKTGVVFIKSNANDIENLSQMTELLKTIR